MATTIRIKADPSSVTFSTPGLNRSRSRSNSINYKRPRGNSISKQLRSASDLEDKGVISRHQKAVLKVRRRSAADRAAPPPRTRPTEAFRPPAINAPPPAAAAGAFPPTLRTLRTRRTC